MVASLRSFFGSRALAAALAVSIAASLAVAPSALAAKRAKAKAKKETGAEVTFTGYQALPGGRGVVFVELTDLVAVEVNRAGQVVEYKMLGARVPLRNNRNPLNLRDFSSSASNAVLIFDKKAHAVKLVITLRGNVQPTHRITARGKGAVLEVELPPLPAK
ncbi:MAG TPA: hypothetical protein VHB79_18060 [Polyangiaceae bacterium]|nr:hypothetical protein [Polyangiaceae bacterium]